MPHTKHVPGTAGSTQDREALVSWLLDRAELHELFNRYLRTPDEDRFDRPWLESLFTEDITVDYTFVRHEGLEGMAAFAGGFFARFARVQHVGTNCLVDVDGDSARVRANVIASHIPDADEPRARFTIGGTYDIDAVRTPHGWRYQTLKEHIVWTSGAASG